MKNIRGNRFIEDPRNVLYKEFVKYVNYFKPVFFVMENVPGLFSLGNGLFKKQIIADFENLNYKTDAKILNSAEYGYSNARIGVPQIRKRVFFIGNRFEIKKKIDIIFLIEDLKKQLKDQSVHKSIKEENNSIIHISNPFPNPNFNCSWKKGKVNKIKSKKTIQSDLFGNKIETPKLPHSITVQEAISDLAFLNRKKGGEILNYQIPPKTEFQKWAREGSEKLHNHNPRNVTKRDFKVFKYMKQGGIYKELPKNFKFYGNGDNFSDKFMKMHYKKPAYTIIAHLNRDGYKYIHPINIRTISVREAARLQSFPDTFHFEGARVHQFQQVGNAVPPLLAMAIAKKIHITLEKIKTVFDKFSISFHG